jgi:hypothetical protein
MKYYGAQDFILEPKRENLDLRRKKPYTAICSKYAVMPLKLLGVEELSLLTLGSLTIAGKMAGFAHAVKLPYNELRLAVVPPVGPLVVSV